MTLARHRIAAPGTNNLQGAMGAMGAVWLMG